MNYTFQIKMVNYSDASPSDRQRCVTGKSAGQTTFTARVLTIHNLLKCFTTCKSKMPALGPMGCAIHWSYGDPCWVSPCQQIFRINRRCWLLRNHVRHRLFKFSVRPCADLCCLVRPIATGELSRRQIIAIMVWWVIL